MTTSLERVVRPNETTRTVFGTGYYTYIAPHVDNTAIPDYVTLTVSANTSAKTTEIAGVGYELKTTAKQNYVEIAREETTVTIKNPDDADQIAKFKALKAISIRDLNSSNPAQTWHFKYPNADNSALQQPDKSGSIPNDASTGAVANYVDSTGQAPTDTPTSTATTAQTSPTSLPTTGTEPITGN